MTVQTPGSPTAQPDQGGSPRDGDQQQQGTETSRNAADDAARDGRSDGEDDLDAEEDPAKLRQMLRDLRKTERKRNEGYNNLQQQNRDLQGQITQQRQSDLQNAPLEEKVKALEKDLAERDAKITRMEQERKDERTEAGIMAAARRLNAADPEDVVRLLDKGDLTIEDDGTPTDAEQHVRALLKKKPHLLKVGSSGVDGGNRGQPGKSGNDMNDLLRAHRSGRSS